MEEKKEENANEIIQETGDVVATPKLRKPKVIKATKEVDTITEIPVAEENQVEPFIEESGSPMELGPKKDKKKKKNKMKEKEKAKAEKAKAKEKAKSKAKKAKKAKKEKAKKAKVKAKAKEKKAKAKSKKLRRTKRIKARKNNPFFN